MLKKIVNYIKEKLIKFCEYLKKIYLNLNNEFNKNIVSFLKHLVYVIIIFMTIFLLYHLFTLITYYWGSNYTFDYNITNSFIEEIKPFLYTIATYSAIITIFLGLKKYENNSHSLEIQQEHQILQLSNEHIDLFISKYVKFFNRQFNDEGVRKKFVKELDIIKLELKNLIIQDYQSKIQKTILFNNFFKIINDLIILTRSELISTLQRKHNNNNVENIELGIIKELVGIIVLKCNIIFNFFPSNSSVNDKQLIYNMLIKIMILDNPLLKNVGKNEHLSKSSFIDNTNTIIKKDYDKFVYAEK